MGVISDCYAFPLLFPGLFLLKVSDTWSVPNRGTTVWNANQWCVLAPMPAPVGQAFSLVVLQAEPSNCFCFFHSSVLQSSWESQCTHWTDFTLSWFDFELAFQVFITVQLLEQGIKSGSFIISSKFGETCCEFDKGVCLGESWRALKAAFLTQDLNSRCTGYGILNSGPNVFRMWYWAVKQLLCLTTDVSAFYRWDSCVLCVCVRQ